MMGFVIAATIVATTGSLVWLLAKAADGSVLAGSAAIGLVIGVLGVALLLAAGLLSTYVERKAQGNQA